MTMAVSGESLVRQDSGLAVGAATAGLVFDQYARSDTKAGLPVATKFTGKQWLYTAILAGIGAGIQAYMPKYTEFGAGFVGAASYQAGVGLSASIGQVVKSSSTTSTTTTTTTSPTSMVGRRINAVSAIRSAGGGGFSAPSV